MAMLLRCALRLLMLLEKGTLTPDEAQTLASILDAHRRAIETQELETRIATVETALRDK
jgi:hypothetical protein